MPAFAAAVPAVMAVSSIAFTVPSAEVNSFAPTWWAKLVFSASLKMLLHRALDVFVELSHTVFVPGGHFNLKSERSRRE